MSTLVFESEIKLKEYNCEFFDYLGKYLPIFNQYQRIAFYAIKHSFVKYGKLDQTVKNELTSTLKEKYGLTNRATDSIVSNMAGRFDSAKKLKKYEVSQLSKRQEKFEEHIQKICKEIQDIRSSQQLTADEITKIKTYKQKLYWKKNKLNRIKQRLTNALKAIETNRYKVCFGTKHLLKTNKAKFRAQRDSEIFFIGRAKDTACNNNFQITYNKQNNRFDFKIRKEIDLENGKYVFGSLYFGRKHKHLLKSLISQKNSPLTYRIKVKEGRIYLQVAYTTKYTKESILTRKSIGVIGVDFNKGFVSVSETDNKGNLVVTFNIDYRFKSGNKTKSDFETISKMLSELSLTTGKDLAIENLDFKNKKSTLVSNYGKKYNSMLSSLSYSTFAKIIESKAEKYRINLIKVNPAFTSQIGETKYGEPRKLNIHSAAAYVIARRGMGLSDAKNKRPKKQKPRYKKYSKRPLRVETR